MSTYDKIWWLPICGGLTGVGLVLSYLVMRRRGLRSGLRGAAWSLLPLAAYLTGSVEMFWKIGVAIGDFAKGLVLSGRVWSGIAVAGLALVLFVVTGGIRSRRVKDGASGKAVTGAKTGKGVNDQRANDQGTREIATRPLSSAASPTASPTASTAAAPAARKGKGKSAAGDEDMQDVEDILRRHGIS
jgi:hypothetical protein